MRAVTGLIILFCICTTFALRGRTTKKNEEVSRWMRSVGGVNVKETVVISRKHGGLLLRSTDANLAQTTMKQSSVMFDFKNKIAAVYLSPKQRGSESSRRGPCFIIPVAGNYNQTADVLTARNGTLVSSKFMPLQVLAFNTAMDLPERRAIRAKSALIGGFCFYSQIINATSPLTNEVIGGSRVIVQGIYRPIIITMNQAAGFDSSVFS